MVACREHTDLALEVARRSIVLLKNDSGLLPLDPRELRRVVLVGDAAARAELGSEGSCIVKPPWVVTPLEALGDALGPRCVVTHVPSDDARGAAAAARRADVAIVCTGLTGREEGEYMPMIGGGDRARLELPDHRVALLRAVAAACPRTVAVLFGGSAFACGAWADQVPAILMAWYPGMQGGRALAEILLGQVGPSGRLPMTFPDATDDLVPFDCRSSRVEYGYLHDYRWVQDRGLVPRFPFGHGLGYARVEYRAIHVEDAGEDGLRVAMDVVNAGGRATEEVVQLYAGKPDTAYRPRPRRWLAAFDRVALGPGEARTVRLTVPPERLHVWSARDGRWLHEGGAYVIEAGRSSQDLPLRTATG